jgi:hypothetical protein
VEEEIAELCRVLFDLTSLLPFDHKMYAAYAYSKRLARLRHRILLDFLAEIDDNMRRANQQEAAYVLNLQAQQLKLRQLQRRDERRRRAQDQRAMAKRARRIAALQSSIDTHLRRLENVQQVAETATHGGKESIFLSSTGSSVAAVRGTLATPALQRTQTVNGGVNDSEVIEKNSTGFLVGSQPTRLRNASILVNRALRSATVNKPVALNTNRYVQSRLLLSIISCQSLLAYAIKHSLFCSLFY